MPRFVLSSNANRDASALTLRAQAKVSYGNALQRQQSVHQGCLDKSAQYPIQDTAASKVTIATMGAQFVTVQEQQETLANAKCQ